MSSDNSENEDYHLCGMCLSGKDICEVVTLKCDHFVCLLCLEEYILDNFSVKIKCPVNDCNEMLTDVQIKQVLSEEDSLRHERLSLNNIPNTHKCLLPECGSLIWFNKVNESYKCVNCSLLNCIKCNVPHSSMKCKAYKKLTPIKAEQCYKAEMERARNILYTKSLASKAEVDKIDLVVNDKIFQCVFCDFTIAKGNGIKLRSCLHLVCRECLRNSIKCTTVIPPKCQYEDCDSIIQDREVYALLSEEELQLYERKGFTRIKLKLSTPFQCQEANCDFFCELADPNVKVFYCAKCNSENCLLCHAVHMRETCVEYQQRIKESDIGRNQAFVEMSIQNGECMKCPDCKNLVKKGSGCNWIQCSNCGLELCWVLKMRRWGPQGRGDESGGCRCQADGYEQYCDPSCYGCIPDN